MCHQFEHQDRHQEILEAQTAKMHLGIVVYKHFPGFDLSQGPNFPLLVHYKVSLLNLGLLLSSAVSDIVLC